VSSRERAIEHGAGEAVDLHDDEPPSDALRAATVTESTDQAIDRSLQEEKGSVQVFGLCPASADVRRR
jgi:hypothetical protein